MTNTNKDVKIQALSCPSCGGRININCLAASGKCEYCGNLLNIQPVETTVTGANNPKTDVFVPLSVSIEKLVREGLEEEAIEMLRKDLSVQRPIAEKVVSIIRSGGYGDARQLFQDAMHGKIKR